RSATARPMPCAPPVITARLPVRSIRFMGGSNCFFRLSPAAAICGLFVVEAGGVAFELGDDDWGECAEVARKADGDIDQIRIGDLHLREEPRQRNLWVIDNVGGGRNSAPGFMNACHTRRYRSPTDSSDEALLAGI